MPPDDGMTGDQLREARLRLGLSQTRLAERFGMHGHAGQVTISRWERGEIPIERPGMLRLAMLGLSVEMSAIPPAAPPSSR